MIGSLFRAPILGQFLHQAPLLYLVGFYSLLLYAQFYIDSSRLHVDYPKGLWSKCSPISLGKPKRRSYLDMLPACLDVLQLCYLQWNLSISTNVDGEERISSQEKIGPCQEEPMARNCSGQDYFSVPPDNSGLVQQYVYWLLFSSRTLASSGALFNVILL